MLFRKKVERSCSYCVHAAQLEDDMVLCSKKGFVSAFSKCGRFSYDPCKRVPPRPKALDVEKYKEEDYSL